MTQDDRDNNTNVLPKEPLVVELKKPVGPNNVLTNDQPQMTSEPVVQPSNEEQTPQQLRINFPFIKALAQMPKYAKFLKGLLTNKARLEEACKIIMNERCSAVLLNKLPSKEKYPGIFIIPCDIGQLHIDNALADLGASISLMPYMMYKKLVLGEPKATRMSLELTDRSIQYPRGIIENVLIKVDKFILLIDFIILDMPEDSRVPIILGRPFLATARAMIDVFNKKITLRVEDDEVVFDVEQSIKRPTTEDDECYGIDDLDDSINEEAQELLSNEEHAYSFLLRRLEKSIDQSDLECCESSSSNGNKESDPKILIRRIIRRIQLRRELQNAMMLKDIMNAGKRDGGNQGSRPMKSILKKTRYTSHVANEAADSNAQAASGTNNVVSVMGMGGTTPSVGKKVSMAPVSLVQRKEDPASLNVHSSSTSAKQGSADGPIFADVVNANVVVDNAQLSIKVVVDTVGGENLSNNGAKCKTSGTSNDLGTSECNAAIFGNNDQVSMVAGIQSVSHDVNGSSPLMKKDSYASVVNASDQVNSTNNKGFNGGVHSVPTHFEPEVAKKVNFRSLVNEEQVDNYDTVFPKAAMENVKNKYANSLDGLDRVLERGPWIILNTPLILNRWTPNVSLKRDEVTKVPVWIKLHSVPVIAYSADGLSLIATQVRKPIMLDAFTSSMCEDSWGRISIARALVEINVDSILKYEVSMAILMEDGTGYTREVIKVEYEWKPPHCTDCKIFRHTNDKCWKGVNNLDTPSDKCTKIVREPVIASTASMNSDGFMEVKRKKNKGKKADLQTRSRHINGIRLNKPNPNFYWQKMGTKKRGADMDTTTQVGANDINKEKGLSTSNSFDALNNMGVGVDCGVSSSRGIQEEELEARLKTSQWNKDLKSNDELDEFIFTEVLINGSSTEEFKVEHGLRQGDPLSPFLFILVVEALNVVMLEAKNKNIFKRTEVVLRLLLALLTSLKALGKNSFRVVTWRRIKFAWIAWDKVIAPLKNGGLGIGSLLSCNQAILSKWWWRFLKEGNAIWYKITSSTHDIKGGLPKSSQHTLKSSLWCQIVKLGNDLTTHGIDLPLIFKRKIGNGQDTLLARHMDCHLLGPFEFGPNGSTNSNLVQPPMLPRGVEFQWSWYRTPRSPNELQELNGLVELVTNLHLTNHPDNALQRLKIFLVNISSWRILHRRLPTRLNPDKCGIDLDSILCPICNNSLEPEDHIFVECCIAKSTWLEVLNW
ncbi:DNA-directed DNA polymerase [Tanacetum coccineum]